MRILLTNDDGIHAPGLEALYLALADPDGTLGGPLAEQILTVAPLTVQSASSHGVTFNTPLMTAPEVISPQMTGISVDGRPADCVKLALSTLWPERFGPGSLPDLVISGLNSGANVGINVIYSGTVAAALEAAFLGVPAIAVSMETDNTPPQFTRAARHARRTIERVLAAPKLKAHDLPLAPHACLSINIPLLPDVSADSTDDLPIRVCPMNTHAINDKYEKRTSPAGHAYYWSAGSGFDFSKADPGTDVDQLSSRCITVTPLRYDMTQHEDVGTWRRWLATDSTAQ